MFDKTENAEPINFLCYCPHCGSDTFKAKSFKEFKCEACGFNFFTNSAAAVVAIVRDAEGRILLTRRGRDPFKGWLDLPGGFVDPGEAAETALCRELKEELEVETIEFKYLCSFPNEYIYSGYKVRTTDLAFICQIDHAPTKCADDVASFVWENPKDIDLNEVPFDSIRNILSKVINS